MQLIKDLKVTAYVGTPSFLKAIIEKSKEMGFDFQKDFLVKKACFAAEPLLPDLRRSFENDYGIDTYQMYGATEVGDVAYECPEKKGWHICEETIVEIVDPATGKNVPDGEPGEIVVTRLNDALFTAFRNRRFVFHRLRRLVPAGGHHTGSGRNRGKGRGRRESPRPVCGAQPDQNASGEIQ